jgi:hypothetical protein
MGLWAALAAIVMALGLVMTSSPPREGVSGDVR